MRQPTRYSEIADYVRELVAARVPGDRLPSEVELCERFGVSRMTARYALQILRAEGLIERYPGRGSFVAGPAVPRLLGSPLSFTESMRRRGLTATSRVLFAGVVPPDEEDAGALGITLDDPVAVLERVRLADGTPMAIERAVITPACRRVLDEIDGGSLHEAFERMGRLPMRAAARVTARPASDREQELLGLTRGSLVLVERRVIYDQDDEPLEHTETRYVAERYQFDAIMVRGEGD